MPALFHCTTGKDRTGWAAAALLLFLGVPQGAVLADYLLSGPRLAPVVRPLIDTFAARGGDPELLRPLLEVRPAYLGAALDEVDRRFGSIEGYFAEGLGLDAATRSTLRDRLVAPG
jgi:protein-tyrosine phosphatase